MVEAAKRGVRRKGVRHRFEYQCSECQSYYKRTEVEVDHIEPAGSLKSFDDIGPFVERMFVGVDKLRVLCKTCHRKITNESKKNG